MNATQYIEHWDKNQTWTHLKRHKHQMRFKRIASYLEGKTFVDVGCAFGHSTNYLKELKPGEWSGIDFSRKAVEVSQRNFPDIDFYYIEDIESLKNVSPFDSVVCSEVIEHVADDLALVEALKMITEKVLVITTPLQPIASIGHLRLYTKDMLMKLFGRDAEYHNDKYFFYVVLRP